MDFVGIANLSSQKQIVISKSQKTTEGDITKAMKLETGCLREYMFEKIVLKEGTVPFNPLL